MTPAELLQAAADRIRDLAAATTPGQWETIANSGGIWREASPERAVRTLPGYLGGMNAAEDARWVAALSPAVAPHLEAILRKRAEVIKWAKSWDEVADIGEYHLARLLCPELAEETP